MTGLIEKLRRRFRREKGSLVIESTLVYPVIFFVILFLLYMGNMYYLKAKIDSVVSQEAIRYAAERGITIGAICAAPMIIGKLGYLSGRSAICYPGFEKYLIGANISAKSVVVDENFITAKGMGAAAQFGLALVNVLFGEECAEQLRKSTVMQ